MIQNGKHSPLHGISAIAVAPFSRLPVLLAAFAISFAATAGLPERAESSALRFARGWNPSRANPAAASVVERTASGRRFHEVAFRGGGFAVVAGEDSNVIAFSPSGELGEEDDGPLWTLLRRDLAVRAAGSSASALAEAPMDSIPDIRVPALVKSKWDQGKADGSYCYNYYTPGHFVCGCVATCMAQIMRYHEFPANPGVPSSTYLCTSNGVSVALTMMGGAYDWTAMPLVPSASSTDASLREVGKICYDAGVSMHMDYYKNGSSAIVPLSVSPFKDTFGFANAATYFMEGYATIDSDTVAGAIYPSLDAGYPVMLGIFNPSGAGEGHAVIADGYGYSDGRLYTHLNMGWSGESDIWYNLPTVSTTNHSFSLVNSVVYNIFPTNSGEIVSGRITNASNRPIAGAVVTATRSTGSGSAVYTATSNTNGIYALVLPAGSGSGGCMYSLTAEKDGMNPEQNSVFVEPSVGFSSLANTRQQFEYDYQTASLNCGNVWGMDFVLTANQNVPSHFYVSATGNDGNDGSESAPFATISAAVEACEDGDAVTVGPGVFAPFTSNGKRITVAAAEGPSATVIDGKYASSCFEDLQGTTNTVISGFTLRRGYCFLQGGGTFGGTLVDCVIENCRSDNYGGGAYGSSLVRCILSRNSAYACGAAESCELVHCTVMGNSAAMTSGGVGGSCNAASSIIFGNTVEDIGECNFPSGSIYIGAFENCCVRPIPPTGSGCFAEDPMVADAFNGDWRLRLGSPCIVANGHDVGAVENACVTGHVVSARTHGGGVADICTKVVGDGGDATVTFSGRAMARLYTNGVEAAASASITLTGITGDIVVDAVFTNYTYHVSQDGSDSNDGLSPETPFATIQHAVDESADCDEILVHPGTYARFTAAGKSIDIVSTDGPASTAINGDFGGRSVFLDFYACTGSRLDGFTVTGGTADYGGGVFGGLLDRCIISGNHASASGGGACGVTACSSLITDNFAGNARAQEASGGGASGSVLLNCTVPNNYMVAAGRAYGGGAYNSEVLNSIVYGNSALGGACDTPDECNCDTSNSFVGVDPGFSDAGNGDFTLSSGSCAIDAGCESYAAGDCDLAGNPRIQRETIDAGCYEFNCPIWISPSEIALNSAQHGGSFTVRAFGDWTLGCDAGWLSLGASSGSGTATVSYTVSANRTGASRDACVTAADSGQNLAYAAVEQIEDFQYQNWHGGHARFGLFVGVDEYDPGFVPRQNWLNGCVSDATSLFGAFTSPRSYWPAENCTVLTNSAATCAAIRGAITNLAARAQSGDTVLYTHSSHGATSSFGSLDTYLYVYDGYYLDSDIAADLSLFREGVNVVVIVDACNSGGLFKDSYSQRAASPAIAESVSAIMESKAAEKRLTASLMGSPESASASIGWITSSDYHQFSWDHETGAGGMFTRELLEGWSTERADADRNGYFDFLELFEYAAGKATGKDRFATTAQAYNKPLLLRTIAGRADTGFRFIIK